MKTLALTGGIACGKSLFASFLAERGADVVDADDLVRALHAPGGRVAEEVGRSFGSAFLASDGGTDRAKLGRLVFSDADARRRLEAIVHPILRDALRVWRDAPAESGSAPLRVAQIPLLFETGWTDGWDAIATVETSSLDVRLARLRARGLSDEEARARIAAQLPSSERVARADFVVRNDAGPAELRALARSLFARLCG